MSPPYDRQGLEAMKRSDLQRLCKDQGIKANLKSEALIDLLLDTLQPIRRLPAEPESKRTSSLRVVSRSNTGSRPRGNSSSSMIIHDTDEEEEEEEEEDAAGPFAAPGTKPPLHTPPVTAPRIRKAKDTQYRLGVGRPALAGGSGARAVTKSVSVSRGKRGKASRSVKPAEEPIREEEEEPEPVDATIPEAGPSGTSHDPDPTNQDVDMDVNAAAPSPTSPAVMEQLQGHITQIIRPFATQIEILQAEFQRLSNQMADIKTLEARVGELTTEVEGLRIQASRTTELEAEGHRLRERMAVLTETFQSATIPRSNPASAKSAGKARAMDANPVPSAPIPAGNDSGSLATKSAETSQLPYGHPGVAAALLGKRHRDSDESHMTGTFEPGREDQYDVNELETRVSRPSKKRPKLMERDLGDIGPPSHRSTPMIAAADETEENDLGHSVPPFTVFSGPEEPLETYIDPPPPTTRLSDLFTFPSENTPPSNGSGPTTTTANGQENIAQNFNFSFDPTFQPVTSTPSAPFGFSNPAFSYPEPPTSPTPGAGPSGGYIERGGRRERNDLFHPFGMPRRSRSTASEGASGSANGSGPPSRASLPRTAPGDGCVNPTALLRSSAVSEAGRSSDAMVVSANVSSSEVGRRMGVMAGAVVPETPGAPMRRTMYGTELEGDTRFGDFGLEGVATDFWTGPGPRP
ncbi:hypothetical protein B0H21DRAFT_741857 [Amylocystis lapponica]|nr:hypothetical protein B0H21DRAFT_741857 [Amylocystis lapponica]